MKRFEPYEAIIAALKDSETLELIEEEGEKGTEEVKRKIALEPSAKTAEEGHTLWYDKTLDRSIYAVGDLFILNLLFGTYSLIILRISEGIWRRRPTNSIRYRGILYGACRSHKCHPPSPAI
jgi:hypothetical protein